MSINLVPGQGDPVYVIDATANSETFPLPAGYSSGRRITFQRSDSGLSGNAVTLTVPLGQYLDDIQDGTLTIPGDTAGYVLATDPGKWQSYDLKPFTANQAAGVAAGLSIVFGG